MPQASDEYDTYADAAYVTIMDGHTASAIAAYLYKIVTQQMGLSDNGDFGTKCDHVAKLLVDLRSEFETRSPTRTNGSTMRMMTYLKDAIQDEAR